MKKKKRCITFSKFLCLEKKRWVRVQRTVLLAIALVLPMCGFTQNQRVTISVSRVDIGLIFRMIKDQTGLNFMYNVEQLKAINPVTLNVKNVPVDTVMSRLLANTPFQFMYKNNAIVISKKEPRPNTPVSQAAVFCGQVTDVGGIPLPGVAVVLKGTTIGTTTDVNGHFEFPATTTGKPVLVFSFIGMKKVEKAVVAGKPVHVKLEEDCVELEEAVSYGYYSVDKRKTTSSVTSLKGDDIMVMGKNTVDQLLEGHVPGMIFMQNSGQVGAAPRVKIRGTTTILGSQAPLWVLDGVILTDPVDLDPQQLNDLDFVNLLGNAISGINPDDIDQIDILKDASATAIYGPQASNGVIVITTKKGKIGKPSVTYSFSGTYRQRPYYTDRTVNVMNSRERIDYSRELVRERYPLSNLSSWVGYEAAYADYYSGKLSHEDFVREVSRMEKANTDWLGILLKNTFSHNHSINVSGGDACMRYYVSLGYMDERGNIKGELNQRYSLTSNLNMRLNKFSLQFGVRGNMQKRDYTPQSVGVTDYAYNTARSVSPYNEDGSLRYYQRQNEPGYSSPFNILNEIHNSEDKINTNQLNLNLNLQYEIMNSLTAGINLSYGISNSNEEIWFGEESWYIAKLRYSYLDEDYFGKNAIDKLKSVCPTGGELNKKNTENENYSLRAQLVHNVFLDKDREHNLVTTVIGELSSVKYESFDITRRGYLKDRGMSFDNYDLTEYPAYGEWLQSKVALGTKRHNLTNLMGLIGSVVYSYKNAYVASVNMRLDASNKFGDKSNEKLLPIWSVSGRWNMHENILKNQRWINTLALKMSFGYQGNMPETESPRLIIEQQGTDRQFGEFYSTIKYYPNPYLRWEKTSTYNVDLEFAFFNHKLTGSIGYYYRRTKDAFLPKTVSRINGVESYTVNAGTLENRGIEWNLNYTPINTMTSSIDGKKKGFVWRLNPNFGSVINQLIDKIKPKDKMLQDKVTYRDYLEGRVLVSGRPVNTFYSYEFKGIDGKTGKAEFYNTEVELEAKYDNMTNEEVFEEVMVRSGQREPFLQGGIDNYFGIGNFSLSFNLTYSIGSKIRLFKMYPNGGSVVSPEQNLRREFTKRWRYPGDELYTNIPGILTGSEWEAANRPWWNQRSKPYAFAQNMWEMYDNSDLRVVSGDYLKLQSVSLRYVIPDGFCRKLHLKSAYVTLGATNLFTICSSKLKGQDPASQSGSTSLINLSLRPTYSVGFNLTF